TRAEQIQPLVDNLGMNPDAAGQQRTDAVVLKFQEETGATPQQAVEILSMAQANQYPVADPARPEQDAKLPGFAVAAQLGTFARRLRLPAPDAAELFKVARLAGVRDEQGMKEFLARLEAGSKDTPINSPAQYVGGFLKAAASQLEARVPLNEVLAQFAAAAGSTTDASVAATNVKQFERAAAGTDDARTLQLAREAERQGVISPASVARELEEVVRPRLAAEQAPQREADERDRREIADAERNLRQVEEAAGPELAVLADSVSRAKRKPERDRAVLALDAKRREVDERKTGLRQRIADRGSAIRRRAEAADQVEREAALVGAYRGLPLATQMKVLRDATDGMDEQERAKRIRAFADGETWQSIVTQVGTAAKEKYAAVAAGSAAADVAGLEERNRSFRTNTLSQASRAELDAEQLRLQGPAGAEYAAGLSKLADADVARLRAAGSGRVGLAAEMGAVVRRLPRSETDTTEDGLKARRMMVLLRDRVAGFLRSTPAAVRQRHAAAIDASWNRFEAAYQDVVVSDRGADVVGGYAGKDRLRKAQEMAAEFGALRASIQADVRPDEPLPVGDEPGAAQVAPPMPVPATPAPVAPHPTPAVTPSAPPSPVPPAAGSPRAMAEPSLPPAGERPAALPERFASAGASDVGDPLVTAVGEFVLRGRREREGGGPVLPPPAPAADPAAPAAPTDAVAAADGDLADARAELARVEAAGWGKDEDDHAPYFRAHAAATKRVRAAEAKVRDA
ncbi:MAG TPA: hypothetical protein VK324_13355, partial [Tepidisphaeraceae bacterium]|nr:hypothetical protein [Tepidisphaeraceae bacterium]